MKLLNPARSQCPYDVGDVLITASAAQPSTRWPGTSWRQIKDVFPLAAGDSYAAGSTGGSTSHDHLYGIQLHPYFGVIIGNDVELVRVKDYRTGQYVNTTYGGELPVSGNSGISGSTAMFTSGIQNGEGHVSSESNMPPYQAFYMWQRTA